MNVIIMMGFLFLKICRCEKKKIFFRINISNRIDSHPKQQSNNDDSNGKEQKKIDMICVIFIISVCCSGELDFDSMFHKKKSDERIARKYGSIFFLLNKLLIMDLTMAKVCTKQKRLVDIHIIKMPT